MTPGVRAVCARSKRLRISEDSRHSRVGWGLEEGSLDETGVQGVSGRVYCE